MDLSLEIQEEEAAHHLAVFELIEGAFRGRPYSEGDEQYLPRSLRESDALELSLVALDRGRVLGNVVFSRVEIGGQDLNWFGLGPVAVEPKFQRRGVGGSLIRKGLEILKETRDARGVVLVGDPSYYQRFGFERIPGLEYEGVDPKYFQGIHFRGSLPQGNVRFHPCFDSSEGKAR